MPDGVPADAGHLLRLIGDTPQMREMSVAEQRYQAVLAVISGGETVTDVAARFGVTRKTVHDWLAKYEAGGLENLGDGSHRPVSCPHQMDSSVEVALDSVSLVRVTYSQMPTIARRTIRMTVVRKFISLQPHSRLLATPFDYNHEDTKR